MNRRRPSIITTALVEQFSLGRIETTIKEELYKKVFRPHDMGHFASLAVNQNFRGLGVPQGLITSNLRPALRH